MGGGELLVRGLGQLYWLGLVLNIAIAPVAALGELGKVVDFARCQPRGEAGPRVVYY